MAPPGFFEFMSNKSKKQQKNYSSSCGSIKLIGIICLFASVFGFYADCLADNQPIGKITVVKGTVLLKRPGIEKEYSPVNGDFFFVGDDIRTEKDSAVQLTFTDDAFVNLFPDSKMRVNQYSFDVERNRRTSRLKLLAGKARFVLYKPRSIDSAFYAETNIAYVTATTIADFGLTVEPRQTEVAVLDQSVSVNNIASLVVGDVWLSTNQKTVVKIKKPPSQPVTLSVEERKNYMKDIRRLPETK